MYEGYIKFKSELSTGEAPDDIYTQELNEWRSTLHKHKLIGEYPDGIGFGNISRRFKDDTFIISGSATGGVTNLSNKDYVLVNSFNTKTNTLRSTGLCQPSSESMTHGTIYQTLPQVRCVMHIHNKKLWTTYKNILPTTAEHIPYGTPEMAKEVKNLILKLTVFSPQIIVMGGHNEGLLVIGNKIRITGERLLKLISIL